MIITSFDGTKIWYKINNNNNNNPFLIFIHGWANNWTTWQKEIALFEKSNEVNWNVIFDFYKI